MVRFHTLAFVLTWVVACGSGPSGPKNAPVEPPNPPVTQVVVVDAGVDAPEPQKLVCDDGTAPSPVPAPEPTWFCARPDGTRHGPFITLFPDGSIELQGAYKDGVLDGPWARTHARTGAIVEQGTYAAGQKHGRWTQSNPIGTTIGEYELVAGSGVEKRWHDEGSLYSETKLKAGVRDGPTKTFAPDGSILNSARYVNGKLDGNHVFGTRNSMRFEETFSNGVRRGPRRIWHQGLLVADEQFDRRGRLDGPYTLWRSSKIARTKGEFSSGKRHGDWVWNDRDGNKEREGRYVNGKRDGDWLEWSEQKLMWSGTYNAGRPDGAFVYFDRTGNELGRFNITGGTGVMLTFHGNRKPASKQYLFKGVEAGLYQELTRAGKVVTEGHYASGVKHGAWKEWNADGVPLLEQKWKRGTLDGSVKKYVDGKLSMETTYVDGKAEGSYVEYRLDKPRVTGEFTDDRKTGTWTYYAVDGAVILTATYQAGVLEGPWRELVGGIVLEGQMVAGRRSGTWTRTDKAGVVRKLTYRTP